MILKKSEADYKEIQKYVEKIGISAQKKQNYKLFRNVDLSNIKEQTSNHYKLGQFRKQTIPDSSVARLNPAFGVAEQT